MSKNTPLQWRVVDGVLRIEIGIDTLAHASLRSEYAWSCANPNGMPLINPETRFKVSDAHGFAHDVASELFAEAEDGSSLVTRLIDKACEEAYEQGSEHWVDLQEEP